MPPSWTAASCSYPLALRDGAGTTNVHAFCAIVIAWPELPAREPSNQVLLFLLSDGVEDVQRPTNAMKG